MQYSTGIAKVILARGLKGDATDCVTPQTDWRLFRCGEQLLPCAIVVFGENKHVLHGGI